MDPKASKLLLQEYVGGECGDYRLWAFDLKAPKAAPVITSLEGEGKVPAGLETPARLALNEVQLAGSITGQSLTSVQESLIHRFDLKVELTWSTARVAVAFVAYRTPTVTLVDAYLLPGGRCALALVSATGKPAEGGYALNVPVLLCAGKPGPVPVRARPDAPAKRPTQFP